MNQGPWPGIALLLSLPMAIYFFSTTRPARAAFLTLLLSVMFLPEKAFYDLPLLPRLDKHTLPALFVGLIIFFKHGHLVRSARPLRSTWVLLAIAGVGAIGVAITNKESLFYGGQVSWAPPRYIPAMRLKDSLNVFVGSMVTVMLPFFIGMVTMRSRRDVKDVLRILVVAGLVYSLGALYEVRMSPQIHRMVYGYGPSDFRQTLRAGGGYRPMVLMSHGLTMAFFMVWTILSAVVLSRCRIPTKYVPSTPAMFYLSAVLVLCKSVGAILYLIFLAPFLFLASRKMIWLGIMFMLVTSISYPVLRSTQLFPVQYLVEQASKISEDRAGSLDFRFMNEERLLAHFEKKPIFGWGGYGRNRVFDKRTGLDLTITDGQWIIWLSMFGYFGFFFYFGVLGWPVYKAYGLPWATMRRSDQLLISAVAFLVVLSMVEELPNVVGFKLQFFMAGALLSITRVVSDPWRRATFWPADGR